MATGGNEQTASPLAEFGSFSVRNSAVNSTIHLCQCRDNSNETWKDKVRETQASALVWPERITPPSGLTGVEVLSVGDGWEARVGRLQEAESHGHRSVAVRADGVTPWLLLVHSIKLLSDYAASRRDTAAADIWVLRWETGDLSVWHQELSKDTRYQRLM